MFYVNKRNIIFFNIKIRKMSSKFCKNQLYSSYILGFFITKLYTIFYYLHYFLLFFKFTFYFVWRNLPTNSNYFTKIYLLFSVTLVIKMKNSASTDRPCLKFLRIQTQFFKLLYFNKLIISHVLITQIHFSHIFALVTHFLGPFEGD